MSKHFNYEGYLQNNLITTHLFQNDFWSSFPDKMVHLQSDDEEEEEEEEEDDEEEVAEAEEVVDFPKKLRIESFSCTVE